MVTLAAERGHPEIIDFFVLFHEQDLQHRNKQVTHHSALRTRSKTALISHGRAARAHMCTPSIAILLLLFQPVDLVLNFPKLIFPKFLFFQ